MQVPPATVEAASSSQAITPPCAMTVRLAGAVQLTVAAGTDPVWLAAVLRELACSD